MNIENLSKWLDALRSNEYGQTTGTLARQEGDQEKPSYCCLGVGCVVADIEQTSQDTCNCGRCEGDSPSAECTSRAKYFYFGSERTEDLPPQEFFDWLDLANPDESGDPRIDWPEEYYTLRQQGPHGVVNHLIQPHLATESSPMTCAALNDSLGLTFSQIADMIAYFGLKEDTTHDD